MWTHIKANPGMGLEEQFMLRWQGAPVATLKPAPLSSTMKDRWSLSLLARDGMSANSIIVIAPLDRAKATAERMSRALGWSHVVEVAPPKGEDTEREAAPGTVQQDRARGRAAR